MTRIKSKLYVILILISCLFFLSINCEAFPDVEKDLYAGIAKIKITPETPIPMSGFGMRKEPFKGIHDDLFVRAIVFSDRVNTAVLISVEVIGISESFWMECTDLISKETGINKDFIFLSAIHTHSGPVILVYNEDSSPDIVAYVKELKKNVLEVTKKAYTNMVPVQIGAGKGECQMNISRRAPDGSGNIILGRNPYAPCDHEVGVVRVDDKMGNPLALLINWPSHAAVIGPRNYLISSDWPGAASRYAEKEFGNNFIAPVFVGASGDINAIYGPHIDFEDNSSYSFGKDAIGEDLANESIRVMKNVSSSSFGYINATQRIISLPSKSSENDRFKGPEYLHNDSLRVRLSVLKVGNIIFTGVSGEVFNQIGVKLRTLSPYTNTFIITHCNGSCGYLVSEDAYPQTGKEDSGSKFNPVGGYEVQATRVKTGAEKAIITNLLEMINAL